VKPVYIFIVNGAIIDETVFANDAEARQYAKSLLEKHEQVTYYREIDTVRSDDYEAAE